MGIDAVCLTAHLLWDAANVPGWIRFRRALRDPRAAQEKKLKAHLEKNRATAFGRKHDFDKIRNYEDFARCVPLADYEDHRPWIERIRQGEERVLTHEKILRFIPTSGSSSARKLIPFTRGLQQEFQGAIGPWLMDLHRLCPRVMGGPAYWSITPAVDFSSGEEAGIPVGFEEDSGYLGGAKEKLARKVMAIPPGVQRAGTIEAFRYLTLLGLLRSSGLRLISVWHPSFLVLLLEALPAFWDRLIRDVETGGCFYLEALPNESRHFWKAEPLPARAAWLKSVGPGHPENFWPELQVISCWQDAAAGLAADGLRRRFPGSLLQGKGLLATEAFVSLPFAGATPLAICSHFFEFIDDHGAVFTAEQVKPGAEYQVVVTTAGGLWRYRLGDRVAVTAFVEKTPSLRFLGREKNISDQFGEKLSEAMVLAAVHEIFAGRPQPAFLFLAPDEDEGKWNYTLYLEGDYPEEMAERLDQLLSRNPHYAWCRRLGQLQAPRVFRIREKGYEIFVRRQARAGTRWGDIKPTLLSNDSGWTPLFDGVYEGPLRSG